MGLLPVALWGLLYLRHRIRDYHGILMEWSQPDDIWLAGHSLVMRKAAGPQARLAIPHCVSHWLSKNHDCGLREQTGAVQPHQAQEGGEQARGGFRRG